LAEVIRPLSPDLILGGKQGIDYDAAQTCPAIAEILGIPQALIVTEIKLSDDKKTVTARRRVEGGDELVEMSLPALVTCEKGLNEPRYASLPGIMKAKKKEIKKVTLADLPLKADRWAPRFRQGGALPQSSPSAGQDDRGRRGYPGQRTRTSLARRSEGRLTLERSRDRKSRSPWQTESSFSEKSGTYRSRRSPGNWWELPRSCRRPARVRSRSG
jgi:electron transfer flavoprotein beta subunit